MPRRSDCAPQVLLEGISGRSLQAMADAALTVVEQTRHWAETGGSVLHSLIGTDTPQAWQHYPDGDARDTSSSYRWYYHSHDAQRPDGEHGHFHLFSEHNTGNRSGPTLTHLVAIAVDTRGLPIRAFTVNRWVTDEVWRDANQVLRLLSRFSVELEGPQEGISRWLAALTRLFAPQLKKVIIRRDAEMALRTAGGRRQNLRDDRRLEVVSQCRLSLPKQMEAIDRRLAVARPRSTRKLPASLAHHEESTA